MNPTERLRKLADLLERTIAEAQGDVGISPTMAPDVIMPPHVVPGELIESAWGNAVVDALTGIPHGLMSNAALMVDTSAGSAWIIVFTHAFTMTESRLVRVVLQAHAMITTAGQGTYLGTDCRVDNVTFGPVVHINGDPANPAVVNLNHQATGNREWVGNLPAGNHLVEVWAICPAGLASFTGAFTTVSVWDMGTPKP